MNRVSSISGQSAVFAPAARATDARNAFAGFLLSGLLLSFVGAILPAWRYHITGDYRGAGACFLFLNIGLLAAARTTAVLTRRTSIVRLLSIGAFTAASAFVLFALTLPPASSVWRYIGFLVLGAGSGMTSTALLYATTPFYNRDRASTLNIAGATFGIGCSMAALLIAGTFFVYTVAQILLMFAAIAAGFGVFFGRWRLPAALPPQEQSWRRVVADFRNPGVVLFTLLLFLQFGNEWAIAGWLPLFLIERLGVSPETSLIMLAVYWLALMSGRLAVQPLLPRMRHGRLLLCSMAGAVFGCVILTFTNNLFGATVAVLCIGIGFAPVYPLVAEKISTRFPHYHPAVFSGLLSFAFTGGMLAPWTIGLMATSWGIRAVMAVPLPGTILVFLLTLLILLHARLNGNNAG
ncbi:MAG TPA: MFS transporter [Bryobacteraceae bacterium]|nr:MFS transporter [Bryobacteraceae bacterium]